MASLSNHRFRMSNKKKMEKARALKDIQKGIDMVISPLVRQKMMTNVASTERVADKDTKMVTD